MKYLNRRRMKFLSVLLTVALLANVVPLQTWADNGEVGLMTTGTPGASQNDNVSSNEGGIAGVSENGPTEGESGTDDESTDEDGVSENNPIVLTLSDFGINHEEQKENGIVVGYTMNLSGKLIVQLGTQYGEHITEEQEQEIRKYVGSIEISVQENTGTESEPKMEQQCKFSLLDLYPNKEEEQQKMLDNLLEELKENENKCIELSLNEQSFEVSSAGSYSYMLQYTSEGDFGKSDPIKLLEECKRIEIKKIEQSFEYLYENEDEDGDGDIDIDRGEEIVFSLKNDASCVKDVFCGFKENQEGIAEPTYICNVIEENDEISLKINTIGKYDFYIKHAENDIYNALEQQISLDVKNKQIISFSNKNGKLEKVNITSCDDEIIFELDDDSIVRGDFHSCVYKVNENNETEKESEITYFDISYADEKLTIKTKDIEETDFATLYGKRYRVYITFDGDEEYGRDQYEFDITVKREQQISFTYSSGGLGDGCMKKSDKMSYSLSCDSVAYGECSVSVFKIKEGADLNSDISQTSEQGIDARYDAGEKEIIIETKESVSTGDYRVHVEFAGDDEYVKGVYEFDITVKREQQISFTYNSGKLGDGNVSVEEPLTYLLSQNSDAYGQCSTDVYKVEKDEELNDVISQTPVDGFDVTYLQDKGELSIGVTDNTLIGKYQVHVEFMGNKEYARGVYKQDITVKQVPIFDPKQNQSKEMTYGVEFPYYFNDNSTLGGAIEFVVYYHNGDRVPDDIMEKFKISYDESNKDTEPQDDGQKDNVIYITSTALGTYDIEIKFGEYENYLSGTHIIKGLQIQKADLQGTITLREETKGFWIFKKTETLVDVMFRAGEGQSSSLLNENLEGKQVILSVSSGEAIESGRMILGETTQRNYNSSTGEITYSFDITNNFNALEKDTEYTFIAEIKGGEDFPYETESGNQEIYMTNSVQVENANLYLHSDSKTEYEIVYGEEGDIVDLKFHDSVTTNIISPSELKVTYSSENQDIVTVDENGKLIAVSGGTGIIKYVVDDNPATEADIYNELSGYITVKVTSPQAGFTIATQSDGKTYNSVEAFHNAANAKISTENGMEYWYSDNVTITIGESVYTHIQCWKDGKALEAEAGSITINYQESAEYEFSFFVEGVPNITTTKILLENIGIDKEAPLLEGQLVSSVKPSEYSTSEVDYFATDIVMSAYADDGQQNSITTNTQKLIDAQSGISKVEIWNSETKAWEKVTDINRNLTSYSFALQDINTSAKVRFTDLVGHSTTVEYKGAYLENGVVVIPEGKSEQLRICVDKVNPKLAVKAIQISNNQPYNGEWINQPVKYCVTLESVQTSGIAKYEYAYVEIGESLQETDWRQITTDELSVSFGAFLQNVVQLEYAADFIYPNDVQAAEHTETEQKVQLNGTVYFRAISNAALVTTDTEIEAGKQELKLWQQEVGNPLVYANKRAAATGWYNVDTNEDGQGVRISFAYPDYNAESFAPPVGLRVTVEEIRQNEDGTCSVVSANTKEYYKGIFEEASGEVIELSNPSDYNSRTNLSTDGTIVIQEDCTKIIKVHTFDLAGNKSDIYTYTVNADYSKPKVENITFVAYDTEYPQNLHTSVEENIIYNVFSNANIEVVSCVDYGISGQDKVTMQQCVNTYDWNNTSTVVEGNHMTITPNTRGFIYLTARDQAGNETSVWTDGFVADNQSPTGDTDMNIAVIAEGANSRNFFNKNVPISIKVSDALTGEAYSGLKSVSYSVGYENVKTQNGTLYHVDLQQPTWEDIQNTANFTVGRVVLGAKENESTSAFITVTATDNAGNQTSITKNYMIDITAPVIDISFDREAGEFGQYFLENRTATIQIKEKNFDPGLVDVTIFKDGVKTDGLTPAASSWRAVSEDVYVTQIVFAEDGDYSFTVGCTDKADNAAERKEVNEFTIDKTKPVVEVLYDNDSAWKDNYYNTTRTATIVVTEHNFKAEDFNINVIGNATLGGWSGSGDEHRIKVNFTEDGYYTLGVSYMDMAGNVMDEFQTQDFYIDTVAPVVGIRGVENHSANAGTVQPVVYASDANYDMSGILIKLVDSTGRTTALERTMSLENEEYSYSLTNVDGLEDGIYTLTAQVTDKAGNKSDVSYIFSLNRNGSTYDIKELTELIKNVYLSFDDMEDLYVIEMNVDTIEEFSIYVSRNGEMYGKCVEGTRPSNADKDTIYYTKEVEGNAELGYRYHYTIFKENFTEEGLYNIMFYSKDRAGNEVNNTLTEKAAEISFVIDNTAPTVVIDGVETDAFYAEDSMDVNVYVDDNFKVKEAKFYLVDEDGTVIRTYDYMELAEMQGEVVTITLPNHDKKMSLLYSAMDAAGNDIVVLEDDEAVPTSFMISTNAWLAYINNKKAVALTIVGVSVVVIGIVTSTMYFRRKKEK